jgi:hypothetical protein
MAFSRRSFALTLAALAVSAAGSAGQAPPVPAKVDLTPEQMEAFLLKGRIIRNTGAGNGVTDSRRATLTDGTITHDAHIQTIDVASMKFESGKATELNFKDTYRYNIAAYRLAVLLGMDNVPVSVERKVDLKMAAVTWWIDDVKMDERQRLQRKANDSDPQHHAKQLVMMRVWDELIQNRDRNQGNIVYTSDWKMWLIDHTRAFRTNPKLLAPEKIARVDRVFLSRLRVLTPATLAKTMGDYLTRTEQEALVARRDALVTLFDERIKKTSEAAVAFDLYPDFRTGQ